MTRLLTGMAYVSIAQNELTYEKHLSWKRVIKAQTKREGRIWDEHWSKAGYQCLADWRTALRIKYGYTLFLPKELLWRQVVVKDPSVTAQKIHSGLYQGWTKYRNDEARRASPYREHLDNERFMTVQDFEHRIATFGQHLRETVVALHDPATDRYVLMDGHHTAGAFAKLYATGRSTDVVLEMHVASIPKYMSPLFEIWCKGLVPVLPVQPGDLT